MPVKSAFRSAQRLLSWIPNLLVIIVLAGIGYFGHRFHWTIPSFSELTRTAGAAETAGRSPHLPSMAELNSGHGSPTAPSLNNPADGDPDATTGSKNATLPSIHFHSANAVTKTGIELSEAELQSMDEFVIAHGTVGYDRTRVAKLSVRVPGTVWRVERHVGEYVQRGEVLAIVNAAEVGRAKAAFLEAMVRHKLATRTLERLQATPEVVARSRIDLAKTELALAQVRRFNTMQALANLGLPIHLDDYTSLSNEEAARKLHFAGLPDAVVKSLDATSCSANLIPLTAPFDAMVTECHIVVGEMVAPERPQFVIADVSRMWLELDVRQEDARKLHLEQTVMFSVNGIPGEIPSRLTWIGTEIDPRTHTVQARAVVDNPIVKGNHDTLPLLNVVGGGPDGRPADLSVSETLLGVRLLRANSFGTARIRSRQVPQAVVVPSLAVQWDWERSQYVVFVPTPDGLSFRARPVHPGIVRGEYTEILEGLDPGEPVVTSGSRMLMAELSDIINEQQIGTAAR